MKTRQPDSKNVTRFSKAASITATFLLVLLPLAGCVGTSEQESVSVRLGENPVAYVKRVTPRDPDDLTPLPHDLTDSAAFFPGASLYIRDVASPRAVERNITGDLFEGPIDVKDLSASYDGRRILFALRAPEIEDADEDEQPTWNIWEHDLDSGQTRRIIPVDLVAEEGQDMAPRYLPDGRILFVSTRQRQAAARLLDEGKPQFSPLAEDRQTHAVALHVMNADGSDIRQISFNPSHDLAPLVLADGRVLMLRWDNKGNSNEFNFWRTRPDGTMTDIVYGADSHVTDDPAPVWSQPALLEDGAVLVMRRPVENSNWSGIPAIIRIQDYANVTQPVAITGRPAQEDLFAVPVRADDEVSPGGRFAAIAPLNDGTGRYLASWAPCRLQVPDTTVALACTDDNLANENLEEAAPAYGLWIFDAATGTQLPVMAPQADTLITSVAVMARRDVPPALVDAQAGVELDLGLQEASLGIIDIRSVYDFAGTFFTFAPLPDGITTLEQFRDPALLTADQRRARFLRIVKGVLIPDDDVVDLDGADFGLPQSGMRELVGYVPIAPDGSVRARVPANVPLDIQVVDRNGRSIAPAHGAWLTVRPGETRQCVGCHQASADVPHGRDDAELPSINTGAPATGVPFPNTPDALFADAGETMAQVLARIQPDSEEPSLDLVFNDVWTDPGVRPVDPDWSIRYSDLTTPAPLQPECDSGWNSLCRAVIHYVDVIQPIWDAARTVDDGGSLVDGTCSTCHNRRDAGNALQVPPGQLELTGDADGAVADNLVSYRELLFTDNEQVLEDGALVDALVPVLDDQGNPVFQTDEEGNLVLDGMGNPIPLEETVTRTPPVIAGASRLGRFAQIFADGGQHAGWLTEAEMKLLSEWIDMGAQNYNDPFAVPQ